MTSDNFWLFVIIVAISLLRYASTEDLRMEEDMQAIFTGDDDETVNNGNTANCALVRQVVSQKVCNFQQI